MSQSNRHARAGIRTQTEVYDFHTDGFYYVSRYKKKNTEHELRRSESHTDVGMRVTFGFELFM